MNAPPFAGFPKIYRYSREVIVTEKIDGTNAQIHITDAGDVFAGSRTRWITPSEDNHGFAKWVYGNKKELLKLGPGSHFGEWWGQGIQRGYGLKEKRFSLFNVSKWNAPGTHPDCCNVVPTLCRCVFDDVATYLILADMEETGSIAAPGFMQPEGIVIYHVVSGALFKKTIDKDEVLKGQVK